MVLIRFKKKNLENPHTYYMQHISKCNTQTIEAMWSSVKRGVEEIQQLNYIQALIRLGNN